MEKSRSWPSAHDWKSCIPQKGIEGSNPSFSANKKSHPPGWLFLLEWNFGWCFCLLEQFQSIWYNQFDRLDVVEENIMTLFNIIQNYDPKNEQEMIDKEQMLQFMTCNDNYLNRENQIAHFTASMWTVNKQRTKTLMVHHNRYNSWSCTYATWCCGSCSG